MKTYTAEVLQFMMPDGRRNPSSTELPIESQAAYLDMQKHGCRFEAEVLSTGHVSVTISDPKAECDVDIHVCANGPDVQSGMVKMLSRALWLQPYAEREV